jgi:murein peptide amidase A
MKIIPDMNNKSIVLSIVCLLPAIIAFSGCSNPAAQPKILPDEKFVQLNVIGKSIENRPIEYSVLGSGNDVILILAAIHGNEPAGVPLVKKLAEHLQQHPQLLNGKMIILLPAANPDGFAHNNRNNVRGVDLNRNFDTRNRINNAGNGYYPLCEPESLAIHQLIGKYAPDRIVSIHQPLANIDYDGPAETLAQRMAEYCDLPLRKLGANPGSLGSYAGLTLDIPIVTLELPGSANRLNQQALWNLYGTALVAAVTYPERPD